MISKLFYRPPELVSIHIPKTAGTSFRNILKSVYGEHQVVRFDINEHGIVSVNESVYQKAQLPSVKVIHGHFTFSALEKNFSLPEQFRLITWLRDPVKRVLSNFYYLEDRLKDILEEKKSGDILLKMQRTLQEYAQTEVNRNRQFKFLEGCKLQDFDFIGITEMFDSELKRLSDILEWNSTPSTLHQNRSGSERAVVDKDLIEEIRKLNEKDVELYDMAIEIRKEYLNRFS